MTPNLHLNLHSLLTNIDDFLTERVLSVRPASQTSRGTFSLGAAGLVVGLSRLCPDIRRQTPLLCGSPYLDQRGSLSAQAAAISQLPSSAQ